MSGSKETSSKDTPQVLKSVRVLLIEDNPTDLRIIQESLAESKQIHFDITWAPKLEKAIEHLSMGEIDVILSDLTLPDSQGIETVMRLRKAAPDKPLVVLTSLDDDALAIEAVKKGAQDYLVKGYVQVYRDLPIRAIQYAIERKRIEQELQDANANLKSTQHELMQSEKLAAIGRVSAGIAHEVKNPLGVIIGGTEYIELKLKTVDQDIKDALEKIKGSALRADAIIKGLLKFSRRSELKKELTTPQALVDEAMGLLKYHRLLQKVKVETSYTDERIDIEVDRNQMQQVLFNVLTNAIEAMPGGGTLMLSISTTNIDVQQSKSMAVIKIKDTGSGIAPENIERLFEPFFTTKNVGEGTGLGLSTAKTIVQQHEGELSIESKQGSGTTVTIELPQQRG